MYAQKKMVNGEKLSQEKKLQKQNYFFKITFMIKCSIECQNIKPNQKYYLSTNARLSFFTFFSLTKYLYNFKTNTTGKSDRKLDNNISL